MHRGRSWIFAVVVTALILALGALIARRLLEPVEEAQRGGGPEAAPVEIALVEQGSIELRRVFSGALEATARITIAPKVAGRITSMPLDLADLVQRGQVVARLDDDEYLQDVAQAEAELAVAKAGLVQAESAAVIAQRELERVETLEGRGIASESQLDTVRADNLAKQAAVQVAEAQVTRAEALLQAARIRLGYTTIRAEWEGGDDQRIVAQRFAEQGDTISANTPLLSIIELDPIEAVIFATEREYALLAPGQPVTLTTDAYPDRTWTGDVARVSPIFREGSRQARVEISIENDDGALRPGMFVRVEAVLGQADDATIVPVQSLTERGGQTVVFVVGDDRATARMMPVTVGIRDGQRVQVTGEGIEGAVVTLGQQLLGEESAITLPDLNGDAPDPAPAATAATTAGGSEG
jgi:RND family efflux transporter MFP subunit